MSDLPVKGLFGLLNEIFLYHLLISKEMRIEKLPENLVEKENSINWLL